VAVEIRTHPQHGQRHRHSAIDAARRGAEGTDEHLSAPLVSAQRESLLELIDHQHHAGRLRRLPTGGDRHHTLKDLGQPAGIGSPFSTDCVGLGARQGRDLSG